MSRLDIITIAIVGICFIALIYLLTKVAQINGPQNLRTAKNTVVSVDTTQQDSTLNQPAILKADTNTVKPANSEKKVTEVLENKTATINPTGRFLVVAASFNTLELAEEEQKRLAKWGYYNSEIGYFNQRKIVAVIIGRYDDYATADQIAKEMKSKHKVGAYVHRKRDLE